MLDCRVQVGLDGLLPVFANVFVLIESLPDFVPLVIDLFELDGQHLIGAFEQGCPVFALIHFLLGVFVEKHELVFISLH